MTLNIDKPLTKDDFDARARYHSGDVHVALPEVDEAVLAEREAMNLADLGSWAAEREQALALLAAAHLKGCILNVRRQLDQVKVTALIAQAKTTVAQATVDQCAAALASVDKDIRQARQDLDDLQAALDRVPPRDLQQSRRLLEKVAAARGALERVQPTRSAPAAALAAAQAELEQHQAELAAAQAAVAATRPKLMQPLLFAYGPERVTCVLDNTVPTMLAIAQGEDVHPLDKRDTYEVVDMMAADSGAVAIARRDERQKVLRDVDRGAVVLRPAGAFR